jgi:Zn-finger nucleic acid-binding protein
MVCPWIALRNGVRLDVCDHCRGIWLDRGGLEKFIARTFEDQDAIERKGDPDRHD